MSKKCWLLMGGILLVAAIVLVAVLLPGEDEKIEVREFRYEHYRRGYKSLDEEVFLGNVSTPEKAIAAAKEFFIEYYGAVPMVTDWTYVIRFDPENMIWMVYTTHPNPYTFSGGYYVLIDCSTGKVMKTWLSK